MNDRIKHCLTHVAGDADECSVCAGTGKCRLYQPWQIHIKTSEKHTINIEWLVLYFPLVFRNQQLFLLPPEVCNWQHNCRFFRYQCGIFSVDNTKFTWCTRHPSVDVIMKPLTHKMQQYSVNSQSPMCIWVQSRSFCRNFGHLKEIICFKDFMNFLFF